MSGRRLLVALGVACFLVLLVRTAWLSDPAYLTLRTVDNAARGLGFGWNPMDRVMVYDHPLWMLLLTAGRLATGEVYFSALGLSIVLSVAAVAMVLSAAATDAGVVLGIVALALSPSFLAYSTSGLEGPLAHALVAAFALVALDNRNLVPRGRRLACLAGLAALAHPLSVALTLPPVWRAVREQPRARPTSIAIGVAPLVAWGLVATWYYGSPIPNPVIARWHTDNLLSSSALHGVGWLLDHIRLDPLALAVVAAGLVIGRRPRTNERGLAAGVIAYLALIVLTGGDMMSGRGLGSALVVATVLVVRAPLFERPRVAMPALASAVALATIGPPTLWSDATYGLPHPAPRHDDARAIDYPATGLLTNVRESTPPMWERGPRAYALWNSPSRVARADDRPGFTGFAAGHGVYVVDYPCDPVLAHVWAATPASTPASLHGQHRPSPRGYYASLPWGPNRIVNPDAHAFYNHVRLVTRGPLSNWRRLPTGLWLALGGYDHLLYEANVGADDPREGPQ